MFGDIGDMVSEVEIPVGEESGITGVIQTSVVLLELFIGEGGDMSGLSTLVVVVSPLWEEMSLEFLEHGVVGGAHDTLHLVEDDSLSDKLVAIHLESMALLEEVPLP